MEQAVAGCCCNFVSCLQREYHPGSPACDVFLQADFAVNATAGQVVLVHWNIHQGAAGRAQVALTVYPLSWLCETRHHRLHRTGQPSAGGCVFAAKLNDLLLDIVAGHQRQWDLVQQWARRQAGRQASDGITHECLLGL
jgi:hypothetical protein